ncbi:MAG: patatin-like phospholipase family protein [Eubacteriales bacterium]
MNKIDKSKEYGIVFTGGGTKGCYEIGAWKAFNEIGIRVKAVAGTSIGAINGALFAQGDYDLAYEKWVNANIQDYLNSSDDNPVTLFLSAVKEKGIDTTLLKKMIKNTIDEEKIRKSHIDYGLVTFSLSDMKPFMVMKKDIPQGALVDYIMASSAFPLFKTPEINGKKYIDGAVYDNTPAPLLAESGCKNIIIVDISGIGVNRNYTAEGLNIDNLYRIKNSQDICGVLEFDLDKIKRGIKMGYLDTMKAFGEFSGRKYYISKKTSDYSDSKYFYPIDNTELLDIFDIIASDAEGNTKSARYSLIKRIHEYSDDSLTMKNILPSCLEIAAEIFAVDPIESYTVDELYELVIEKYTKGKNILKNTSKVDLIKGKYKSFDWTNINRQNLVVYLMNLSEKETLSKKHLINFMPKVYITYLLIKFIESRKS